MSRKVKITLPGVEVQEVKLGDKTIKVDNYITLEKYETILADIKSTVLYNSEIDDKYALLHLKYIKLILDLCTNIDTGDLGAEELSSPVLKDILIDKIENFFDYEDYLEKEYDKLIIENSFGILANKLPSSTEMEKSMKALSNTIENLPEDKLELISKSIVWNNMPALGNQVAPATHITEKSE